MELHRIKRETDYVPFIPGLVLLNIDEIDESGTGRCFVFIKEADAQNLYISKPGQLNMNSPLGESIYMVASNENGPKDWLEIGTWNGLGSTACILNAFTKRNQLEVRLLSLELDPVMFGAAEKNLQNHPALSCVTFIKNKLTSSLKTEFPSIDSFSESEKLMEHFRLHFDRERGLYQAATGYIPSFAPEAVILDGGEYSGYFDWVHLDKSRLMWIFLDDINTYKNKRVLDELLVNPEWICMHISDSKNGYAVFSRKN